MPPFAQYPFPAARFSHAREQATPGRYRVALSTGIAVDLTATSRTGYAVVRFPTRTGYLAFDAGGGSTDQSAVSVARGGNSIRGFATDDGFCGGPASPTIHFAARFDRPIASFSVWGEDGAVRPDVAASTAVNTGGAVLGFRLPPDRTLRVAVGVSYVSEANAAANLAAEGSPRWDGEALARSARARWNARPRPDPDRRRDARPAPHLHDRALPRADPSLGRERRQRRVPGPRRPRPPSPGLHAVHAHLGLGHLPDADAAARAPGAAGRLRRRPLARRGRLRVRRAGEVGARRHRDRDHGRRPCTAPRRRRLGVRRPRLRRGGRLRGDVPHRLRAAGRAVSLPEPRRAARRRPLGAVRRPPRPRRLPPARLRPARPRRRVHPRPGVDDARVRARGLRARPLREGDRRATRAGFATRSASWRRLFNPATRHLEPRLADGSFLPGFSHTTEDGFVEGNSAQYTWFVPHDVAGLAALMGGDATARSRLDRFHRDLDASHLAPYAWLGNEPSFGTPWLYNWLGAPWRTQAVVRRAVTTLFRPLPAGLPGDDDLGALSAWYVWSALGLYPAVPGVGGLAIASPLFPSVTIRSGLGPLRLDAPGRRRRAAVRARPPPRRASLTSEPGCRSQPYVAGTRSASTCAPSRTAASEPASLHGRLRSRPASRSPGPFPRAPSSAAHQGAGSPCARWRGSFRRAARGGCPSSAGRRSSRDRRSRSASPSGRRR